MFSTLAGRSQYQHMKSLCQYVIFQIMRLIELRKVKARLKEGHRSNMEIDYLCRCQLVEISFIVFSFISLLYQSNKKKEFILGSFFGESFINLSSSGERSLQKFLSSSYLHFVHGEDEDDIDVDYDERSSLVFYSFVTLPSQTPVSYNRVRKSYSIFE